MSKLLSKKDRTSTGLMAAVLSTRKLIKGKDHGDPISIHAQDIGATGERWIEPFLAANQIGLRRLDLKPEIRADRQLSVRLIPGPRIGAIPLLNPSTRKVAAGLLIEPRFHWSALGSVFNSIGFSVEPELGGAALVPGSAREVPPWMLAGPVIERITALLRHRRRGFVTRSERRSSPRGGVEWAKWATSHLPHGDWTTFPCCFSEPDDDPDLIAAVRWTLSRLTEELLTVAWTPPARYLLHRAAELLTQLGPGILRRPPPFWSLPGSTAWVNSALEAMKWVADERGLGGARSLDGIAWDLSIDAVWEAWVATFSADLGRRLGLITSPFQTLKRSLQWEGSIHSMGALVPDIELRGDGRAVWIDAKYKAHLQLLTRGGWRGLSEEVQAEHRADLHQALAYASLSDVQQVDTVLLYPRITEETQTTHSVATVTSGRRRVRLILASLPFGFINNEHQERSLNCLRELLGS